MRMMSSNARKDQHMGHTVDEIQNLNNTSILSKDSKQTKNHPSNMPMDLVGQSFSVIETFYKLKG